MDVVIALMTLLVTEFTGGSETRQEQQRVAELVGVPAKVTDAPFTVALVKSLRDAESFKEAKPFCTGSIIDPEWVLTAAHCIQYPELPKLTTVVAGADDRNQFSSANVQRKVVKEQHTHPYYWKDRVSKYDVAVMRVEDKFEFNDRVKAAELWAKPWVKAAPKSSFEYGTLDCKVFGWGAVEMNVPSDVLRTVTLAVVHGEKACVCYKMYQQRRLVCSRDKAGYLCFGDSGGPLVCEEKLVAGVAHVLYHRKSCSALFFGKIKLRCNDPNSVSAWMYVCPMLDFIHEHVPSAPPMPASCRSPPLQSIPSITLRLLTAFALLIIWPV